MESRSLEPFREAPDNRLVGAGTGRTEAADGRRMGAQSRRNCAPGPPQKAELEGSRRKAMPESVYKVIELIGTSTNPGMTPPRRRSSARLRPCAICASRK